MTSWTPAAISPAANETACCPDPHRRSTELAGVVTGSPAYNQALRAMLLDCSPT